MPSLPLFELLDDHTCMEYAGGISSESLETLRSFFDALSPEDRQAWHAALLEAANVFHREFLNEERVELRRLLKMAGNPN
jgi:hypothetical protein